MDAIKRYILDHGLSPGAPLPTEAVLCADLGVSRSSVREAMRKLEALDIVRSQRGSGSFVGEMSMKPLVETLVLRSALDHASGARSLSEVVSIRKALDLGIGAALVASMKGTKNPDLWRVAERMKELAAEEKTYYDEDIAFHSGLLRPLENTLLEQLISAMWLIHQSVTPKLDKAEKPEMMAAADAHSAILAACEAGDIEAYEFAVEQHYAPLRSLIENRDTD